MNIIEIIILPLIFGLIFGSGIFLLIYLGISDYVAYTGWCLISGVIILLIILTYTYRTMSSHPKLAMHDPRLYEYYRNINQDQNYYSQPDPYGRPITRPVPRSIAKNMINKNANLHKPSKIQTKKKFE